MIRTETRFTVEVLINFEYASVDIGSAWDGGKPTTNRVLQLSADTKSDVINQLIVMRSELNYALAHLGYVEEKP